MLALLDEQGKLSGRKARLFAVACCHRVLHLFEYERSQSAIRCPKAVRVAELHADVVASTEALGAVAEGAWEAYREIVSATYSQEGLAVMKGMLEQTIAAATGLAALSYQTKDYAVREAAKRVAEASVIAWEMKETSNTLDVLKNAVDAAAHASQAALLRDIFGNPFQPPPAPNPRLLTPDTLSLALFVYDQRSLPEGTLDPTRLALLADALAAAGCTD